MIWDVDLVDYPVSEGVDELLHVLSLTLIIEVEVLQVGVVADPVEPKSELAWVVLLNDSSDLVCLSLVPCLESSVVLKELPVEEIVSKSVHILAGKFD